MKNLLFIIGIILFSLNSCASNVTNSNHVIVPTVQNPTYSSYMNGVEKGYEVDFDLNDEMKPIAVVLFGMKKLITNASFTDNHVKVVVPRDSSVSPAAVEATDLPNGIMYEINGKKYLRATDFIKK